MGGKMVYYLSVYVDDILITGSYVRLIDELQMVLKSNFKLKDLVCLRYFLGFGDNMLT